MQPLFQLEPVGIQGWVPIIGERAPDRQAIPTHRFGFFIAVPLECSFNGTHPAHVFLEYFLGMPIGVGDRASGFPQVMKMT